MSIYSNAVRQLNAFCAPAQALELLRVVQCAMKNAESCLACQPSSVMSGHTPFVDLGS